MAEVFATFLKLGVTSFGGPVAHIGYFRREVVERRAWLSDSDYGELVGLCQFLPGPASSQVGFGVGLLRAGALGGLAAWLGFTLPSAVLMLLFARYETRLSGPIGTSVLHGLKLVAVPVVAQAILAMARTLTPDARRLGIALVVAMAIIFIPSSLAQLAAIALGGLLGLLLCRAHSSDGAGLTGWLPGRRVVVMSLGTFTLLLGLSVLASGHDDLSLAAGFYRAGALVFGGGHVVLPLLRAGMVPRWIDAPTFLAGYGAAQAVPGPLLTFATFLGGRIAGVGGAIIATIAIFLPGLLLVAGILPVQHAVRNRPALQKALTGINAAVVGILVAALATVVVPTAVRGPVDVVIALAALALLMSRRLSPLVVVSLTVAATILAGLPLCF